MTNLLSQAIPGYETFSQTAKNLLRDRFTDPKEPMDGGYEKTTEYNWESLCPRFDIPKDGNKEKEIEDLSDAYFVLYDIEKDCYVVEC